MTAMFADKGLGSERSYLLDPIEVQALNVLPMPVLVIGEGHAVIYANTAAEDFFQSSAAVLKRQRIDDLIAFGSPVLGLIEEVQRRGASVSEYRLDLGSPRLGSDRVVDVFASPLPSQGDAVVLMLQERTIAEKSGQAIDASRGSPVDHRTRCHAGAWGRRIRFPASGARRSCSKARSPTTIAC
ncbi:histidine kinase OS=Bosea thiooxidans OX=53254 GN=SAMN05660750_01297 PE=4 SV=1 [Bosea thiooxidans]